MVFLENLADHHSRECCIGAAEYAANQPELDFIPWPFVPQAKTMPSSADFRHADCMIVTEQAHRLVFGKGSSIPIPHLFLMARHPLAVPTVGLDETACGRMAAEHLINRGYPHLASIASSEGNWSQARAESFNEACRAAGREPLHYNLSVEVLPAHWDSKIGRHHREIAQLLQELPKPCGIFAANDVMACFIIEAARLEGLAVPRQLGVIGVDNDPVPNAAAGMTISSVQPPFREIGRQAAALLDRLRQSRSISQRLLLPPIRVVARTSTDAFMVPNSLLRRAQAYIEKHRAGPVRVSQMEKALSASGPTLVKHFQRHLHVAPAKYILSRRIEYARELLREGRLNVQQISETCGFHSCAYFCKIFKQVTSITPTQAARAYVVK